MKIVAIDVTNWHIDDEHAVFPIGARDKEMLWSPKSGLDGLKKNWPYLFKQSRDVYPDQYWMETVAHLVGNAMRVRVPFSIPAYKKTEEGVVCGALIEWFYDPDSQVFVHAADYFHKLIKDFDDGTGKQHNIVDLIKICRTFTQDLELTPRWQHWYFDLLLFDALIGNSDRHQENWGFIFEPHMDKKSKRKVQLSPLFDNGTSLGHERFTDNVQSWDDVAVDRYINKGKHHLRRTRDNTKERLKHLASIEALVQKNPRAQEYMKRKLKFNLDNLLAEIRHLCDIDTVVPFTKERAEWTIRLLDRRYHLLSKILYNA